jgi:hypothetical protein
MKMPTKLTYTEYNKTVCIGDELTVRWDNGMVEKFKVAEFSPVSNQPISNTGKLIFLQYVVW